MPEQRHAVLYRMVTPEHTCPFGVRARQMLEQNGYQIEEHLLTSRGEVDAFKAEHDLVTTPLIFIDGERVGGSDDLERLLAEA